MAKKDKNPDSFEVASADAVPLEQGPDAAEVVAAIIAPVENPPEPISDADPNEKREARHWAAKKGHLFQLDSMGKPKAVPFRGDAHKGLHLAIILAHTKLASNSLLTEAEYDQAADAAGSLPIG